MKNSKQSKNIIIGIGNILFCDDGIGVFASKVLKEYYKCEPEIEIIDGGTLGIGLINYFTEYDNVFILDTISLDDEVGSMYILPSSELLNMDGFKNTAHEVEVVDMIRTASLIDNPADVTICAIVPYDIQTVSIGLSFELEQYFDKYINVIVNLLNDHKINITKSNNYNLKSIYTI